MYARTPSKPWIAAQALLPEIEGFLAADPPDDSVHHPRPGAPATRAGVLEEGDVAPGATDLVGVEEVVDRRVVLVHRLLDEPEAEHARVEIDVARRVARDAGDVVDTVESHVLHPTPRP